MKTMVSTSMASLAGGLFCTGFLILASMNVGFADAARFFNVGDEFQWQEPGQNATAVYTLWASRNRFQVGDSLSFEYRNDSVLEVDKWGFYHCNGSQPIAAFNNGKSVFNLDRPGRFYFISGTPNHCKNGQRLLVQVMGLHHHGLHSPPSIANPPESYLAPSPQPSSGVMLVSMTLCSVSVILISSLFTMLR